MNLSANPSSSPARRQRTRWIAMMIVLLLATNTGTHFVDRYLEGKSRNANREIRSGPWGDLVEREIRVEQPMEFVSFDKIPTDGPVWNFGHITEPALQDFLASSGLGTGQIGELLRTRARDVSGNLLLKPDEATLLSISPDVRSRLYLTLAGNPANRFQSAPYYIPGGNVRRLFDKHFDSNETAIKLVERLLYSRNGFTYFSDPEIVLSHLPKAEQRVDFLQNMTSQNAVQLGLQIKPDTDIDKPLNYWSLNASGVTIKDLRPLLEAEQRLPKGGALSILYLLPPMARERLFTSPLPPQANGQNLPDCHWTALNFFTEKPDARMSDNAYASEYIARNYYEIGKPGIEGDLVLLLNSQNRVVHSAVHLADDVVFTKNGVNFAQPWILMHEKEMIGAFSALEQMKVAYFRRRNS